jgi:hypothetical protein
MHKASSAASHLDADTMKQALPAVGAAAGVGLLAWALRRARRKP